MSLRPCPAPVAQLLPHRPPMVLLDEAVGYDEACAVAVAVIGPDHPFLQPEGVPTHLGIELMAQACGVYVGAHAQADGRPVRLGYLLGTRDFRAHNDWFRPGDRLEVTAAVVFRDDGMGVFDCRIARDGAVVAEAQLTVYQPPEGNADG